MNREELELKSTEINKQIRDLIEENKKIDKQLTKEYKKYQKERDEKKKDEINIINNINKNNPMEIALNIVKENKKKHIRNKLNEYILKCRTDLQNNKFYYGINYGEDKISDIEQCISYLNEL